MSKSLFEYIKKTTMIDNSKKFQSIIAELFH